MTIDRGSRVLGRRVGVPGESASTQPPKRFRIPDLHRKSAGSGQIFPARWEPYQRVVLAARQIDGHQASNASLVCDPILGQMGQAQSPGDLDTPVASAVKMIGSVNAIQ